MEKYDNSSFVKDFQKALDLWTKDDYKGLENLQKELEEKANKAKKEYEPYGEHVRQFNRQADLYFKEEKSALKKRNSPRFKAFIDMYRAFLFVFSTGNIIAGILNLTGVTHSSDPFMITYLQLIALMFFFIFDFYSSIYINPWRRFKWPKNKKGFAKAYKNYELTTQVSYLPYFMKGSMSFHKLMHIMLFELGSDKTKELLRIMEKELCKDE